ncbi:hypothetical protein PTKIN_Ptkin04bG0058900 [Pterospermum kingtungense]
MAEPRETHLGKLCDTCGAVGYKELTRTCSQCTIRRHIYCMPVFDRDMPEDWVCELCLPKNDTDALKPDLKEDVLDSSREACCDLGRQIECKRQKAVETGKVKFLPTEEVIKLSSGTPKKEISLKSYFGSKPVPEKATTSLSKRSFSGSRSVDPYFKPIKVRKNPSFLQLEPVNPPRRGGVQISSSIRQHAVKTLKESKVESAHVVPNKENVCKGQMLDAILPDKDLSILQSKNKESMRLSLTSPSRLHTNIVGSGQNCHQAVEDDKSDVAERKTWDRLKISLYRPYLPTVYTTWTGGFKFLDAAAPGEFYGGFLARPSCRVHRKAYELSQKMPPVLRVNLLQQCHLQADLFQNGCLDLRDIALYFFPVDYMERSQENYNQLFQLMVIKNSVMISYIDGMELLIFTSRQLHADSQDVFTRSHTDFFGGMFRRAKDNQIEVHQKFSSFVSHLEYTHDDNANMGSGEEVDMDIDMVGGKIVGIPDIAFSKESMQEFVKWAAKETLDATRDRKLSSVSGNLNPVIEPTLLESEKECCNDSDLPPKSTEKMTSKSTPEPVQHPLEISLGSLPGNMGEIDIPPGFEVISKLNSSDRAPKAPNAEEKIDLDEKQIMSQVKAEIGCQITLQVASGVSSRPQPHRSAEDASLRGSQKQHQVSANDPSVACSPPPCLLGEGTKVRSAIKIEGNDDEKPFQSREKKGRQGPTFLSKDKAQIAGSCAVEVKAEVQELAYDPSAVCPRLLEKDTKIGLQIKTQEFDEEKPDESRGKKGLEAGSFDGPCAVMDKAKMQKVKHDKVNTSHGLHTTLPSNMETSLLSRPFASTRVRLSVAGRSSGNPGAASAGGLIRDESGSWIVGYNLKLGLCGCLAADLWALFQGIKFTWDRGYRKVLIESDSAAAVESLKKAPPLLNSNRALIERCYDLLHDNWDCKVCAIRREENLCADWLATHVKGQLLGISIINSPPAELIPLLEVDSIRVGRTSFSIF